MGDAPHEVVLHLVDLLELADGVDLALVCLRLEQGPTQVVGQRLRHGLVAGAPGPRVRLGVKGQPAHEPLAGEQGYAGVRPALEAGARLTRFRHPGVDREVVDPQRLLAVRVLRHQPSERRVEL